MCLMEPITSTLWNSFIVFIYCDFCSLKYSEPWYSPPLTKVHMTAWHEEDWLLPPWTDLQKTSLENAELVWFSDGSYLKDEMGHYQARYALISLNKTTEASPVPQATSVPYINLNLQFGQRWLTFVLTAGMSLLLPLTLVCSGNERISDFFWTKDKIQLCFRTLRGYPITYIFSNHKKSLDI